MFKYTLQQYYEKVDTMNLYLAFICYAYLQGSHIALSSAYM